MSEVKLFIFFLRNLRYWEFAYAKLDTFFAFSPHIKVTQNPLADSVVFLRDYAKDRRQDEVVPEFDIKATHPRRSSQCRSGG